MVTIHQDIIMTVGSWVVIDNLNMGFQGVSPSSTQGLIGKTFRIERIRTNALITLEGLEWVFMECNLRPQDIVPLRMPR